MNDTRLLTMDAEYVDEEQFGALFFFGRGRAYNLPIMGPCSNQLGWAAVPKQELRRAMPRGFILFAVVILLSLSTRSCDGLFLPFYSTQVIQRSNTLPVVSPTTRRRKPGSLNSQRWENKFQELVKFKKEHGHVNVPQLPNKQIPGDYKELATFCRNVRSHYKYLAG